MIFSLFLLEVLLIRLSTVAVRTQHMRIRAPQLVRACRKACPAPCLRITLAQRPLWQSVRSTCSTYSKTRASAIDLKRTEATTASFHSKLSMSEQYGRNNLVSGFQEPGFSSLVAEWWRQSRKVGDWLSSCVQIFLGAV